MPRTLTFGNEQVPVPGLGCMGFALTPEKSVPYEQAAKVMAKAVEIGCTFWDSAVVYGAGKNEEYIGRFFKENNCRDKVFIASKCGFEVDFASGGKLPGGCTNSAEHIRTYLEGTTKRLGSAPDLYYLHRRDPKTPLEESIGTLDQLRKEGKTRYIGISECSAETLRKAHKIAKIDAVQAEYSPFESSHERSGLIDACRELGVAFVAFSPIGRGLLVDNKDLAPKEKSFGYALSERYNKHYDANNEAVQIIRDIAEKKGCAAAQLALAWVISQGFLPIPGTTKPERVEANFKAGEISLSEAEIAELRKAIDGLQETVKGERYNPKMMQQVGN